MNWTSVFWPPAAVPNPVPAPSPLAVLVYWKVVGVDAVTNQVPLYPDGVIPVIMATPATPGFKVLAIVTVVPDSLAAVIGALGHSPEGGTVLTAMLPDRVRGITGITG